MSHRYTLGGGDRAWAFSLLNVYKNRRRGLMKQRGRKSDAALASFNKPESSVMQPPPELSDAQAQVWRDVIASLPPDWIHRGNGPILVAYCRHVCRARLLEAQIEQFEVEWTKVKGGLERLKKLLEMAGTETRSALSCARALRLTPSTLMRPETAARRFDNNPSAGAARPWD